MDDVAAHLRSRFGSLKPPVVKPFSVSFRTIDDQALIKVYRGVEPAVRQRRELDALSTAPTLGLAVPRVLDHGRIDGHAWTAFEIVPGEPGRATDSGAPFLAQATTVMTTLHRHVSTSGAGSGWAAGGESLSNSAHLVAQLSARARAMRWWPAIATSLLALDDLPSVYLHGDLKPEHILVSQQHLHVVDWEACGRGPAACDFADAFFHLARDLAYAGERADATALPIDIPAGFPAVLVWRLVLWADRRRDEDLARLPVGVLSRLADEEQPQVAASAAAAVIRDMRRLGTPR